MYLNQFFIDMFFLFVRLPQIKYYYYDYLEDRLWGDVDALQRGAC